MQSPRYAANNGPVMLRPALKEILRLCSFLDCLQLLNLGLLIQNCRWGTQHAVQGNTAVA